MTGMDLAETSDAFEFSQGDHVLVRVRENGTTGKIEGKFKAEVLGFHTDPLRTTRVHLDPPWTTGLVTTVKLHSYDAEFEVLQEEN